jgi:hypothetical protein
MAPPPTGYVNIAKESVIASSPPIDARQLHYLIDDRDTPKGGMAFPVKSAGAGSVTFRFRRPRTVSGLHFHQPSTVYYATAFRILADVTGNGDYGRELGRGSCPSPPRCSRAFTGITTPSPTTCGPGMGNMRCAPCSIHTPGTAKETWWP